MLFGMRCLGSIVALLLLPVASLTAQDGQPASIPVIRTTSTLVFLDVTVLDKKGRPVVTGLNKDDFTITEDKKPQRIFSFEEPEIHLGKGGAGQVPETVLVLDLLNTAYPDFAFVRDQAKKFLLNQSEELRGATEIMVVGNQTLELLQGFTRRREDLLFALDHMPFTSPFKEMNMSWETDRIRQSYIALQQIAAQNRGVPGRKNVIWIGSGSPDLLASSMSDRIYDKVQKYIHRTVNMMVEARISLFLIYPGLRIGDANEIKRVGDLISGGNSSDPFADSSFTEFVYETGGKVFDSNDVSSEIDDSVQLGSKYYTLTYQPHEDKADGAFRRIEVKMRNPDLRVMTKAGFFSREPKEEIGSDDQTVNMLSEAAQAVIPMTALQVKLASLVRHPDAHTVEIRVRLEDPKLGWESMADGSSGTTVVLTAVSKSKRGDVLASRVMKFAPEAKTQDAALLAGVQPKLKFTLRVPRDTHSIRVAVATGDGSRIGSVDVDRKQIDSAPEAPSPDPHLLAPSSRRK